MIVGLTSGVWDLIHVGHLHYLESCRNLCDKLIVGVDCDEMVRAAKGPKRPYIPEDQRLDLVNSLRWVDAAFKLKSLHDLDDISKRFHVNRVFKHQGFKNIDGKIWGVMDGVELMIVPDICGLVSTSALAKRIMENKDSLGRGDERDRNPEPAGTDQCNCGWPPETPYPACVHDLRGHKGPQGLPGANAAKSLSCKGSVLVMRTYTEDRPTKLPE